MKRLSDSCLFLLAAACAPFVACNEITAELQPQDKEYLTSLTATVLDFEIGEDESATRTSYEVSPTEGFIFSWALGDTLGIYPVGGNQVDFPISDGFGTKTALFDGGSWALRSSYTYAGYYPYNVDHYRNPQTAIPVTFAGQKQSGNNMLDGLSQYDYMAAAPVGTSLNGSVNLELKHLASFVRFQLTMPSVGNYTSLTLTSSDVKFIETATYDLTSETPSLTPVTLTETFTLALEDISTTEANQVITLYAMIAPVSQKSSNITIRVVDEKGNAYSIVTTGKNLTAGKSYNYTLTLENDGTTGGTGEDAGWGDDEDRFNGYDYVDLDLPSGVKWATCNVGASVPEEFGYYYAWGEIEPKDIYTKDTYSHFHAGGATDSDGFTIDLWDTLGDICSSEYDVAHQEWGGAWRMPTHNDFKELYNNCTWTWSTKNNVNGYKVTGSNGNWIFLPAAGYRNDAYLSYPGVFGHYWSSMQYTSSGKAFFLNFDSNNILPLCTLDFSYFGCSIRPVAE